MPAPIARPKAREAAPAPRRRRLAPEERAAQILDFAARLIIEEGLTELSMERLGREAGISKALIYNYFPNRNDLLRVLLEREMEVLRERQVAQIGQATDLRDLILRTTRTYVAQVKERGALLQRLWAEPAVARQVAEQSVRKREEALRFMVREVIKTYGLPRDVAISAVDMGMAMTEAAAQHLPKSRNDVDFATHVCVNLLIGGLEALAREHAARPAARPAARKSPARRGASRA